MPPPRPRGVGYNTGVASARPSQNTPMSERQQMALLIQMTATSTSEISRSHLKKNDHKKSEEIEESNLNEKQDGQDVRDKSTTDEIHSESKKDINSDHTTATDATSSNLCKRNFSDIDEEEYEDSEDVKKKKRKDSDSGKEQKPGQNLRLPGRVEKNIKQTSAAKSSPTSNKDSHPHDFPFTNCFQMYLNIRRQIEKKWRNMYPVKPRPPQGYNEYLINKRTYLLTNNNEKAQIKIPNTVSSKMREIFLIQEKERRELCQRHIVEREKLCLNVEQEIIRVHSKAARNISCQSVPYSFCTLLKDEEVYNIITPEQEEKDRSARYRFNGRLLLSWLQDVDDKWEKIKESMVLRHHNESESLHAVQLMDWEIAMKKYELCDYKTQLIVEKDHVPIVHVSDDFELLPA